MTDKNIKEVRRVRSKDTLDLHTEETQVRRSQRLLQASGFKGFTVAQQQLQLTNINSSDSEDETDVSSHQVNNMETENLVRRLAEVTMQLAEMQAGQPPRNDPLVTACKNILKFDKENLKNYLKSVELAIDDCKEDAVKIKKVLDYAKIRCSNDVVISSSDYTTFVDFKKDVVTRFRPTEDSTKITANITRMLQKRGEPTKDYGERAIKMKDQYLEALFAEYEQSEMELTAARSKEAERLVVRHFQLGLFPSIRSFIIQNENDDLLTAISKAASAETSRDLATALHKIDDMNSGKFQKDSNARNRFASSEGNRGRWQKFKHSGNAEEKSAFTFTFHIR